MSKSKTKKQRCSTGKRRFRDHAEACRALRSLLRNSTRQVKPQRSYPCDLCHGYHLTSKATWDSRKAA